MEMLHIFGIKDSTFQHFSISTLSIKQERIHVLTEITDVPSDYFLSDHLVTFILKHINLSELLLYHRKPFKKYNAVHQTNIRFIDYRWLPIPTGTVLAVIITY
ncbi:MULTISPECIES: hypothetical protein [Pontibacillus]|uniref:Uncharacterized protein n=1 Tax=Pontibacillus chungwhensis TaxID=265426 RepID=A0ABY8V144_9BACI|nr:MULTISPECIES: hypothetical protein [Pontibacillus]MCD5324338.1 hypothetical protein [Pontibacillus sp. HN14]WIF99363.1 hypothetical protein QNI29_06815 [Pontibacillus chungwhensis]